MSSVDKIKKEQEAEGKTKVNNSLLNNSVEQYNNNKHPKVIDVDKAIIVSDIHIGYEKSNVVAFTKFLERIVNSGNAKDYSLFIIGDLWDYWRKHDVIFSSESDMVLALINQFKELYYIP